MFKNYIKIALRNLQRHKAYSLLNISGLAIGMACSILILLWDCYISIVIISSSSHRQMLTQSKLVKPFRHKLEHFR